MHICTQVSNHLSLSFSLSQSLSLSLDLDLSCLDNRSLELDLDLERLLLYLLLARLSEELSVFWAINFSKASNSFFFCSFLQRLRRSLSRSASRSSSVFGSSSWRWINEQLRTRINVFFLLISNLDLLALHSHVVMWFNNISTPVGHFMLSQENIRIRTEIQESN